MEYCLLPNQSINIVDIQNYLFDKTGISYENFNKTF